MSNGWKWILQCNVVSRFTRARCVYELGHKGPHATYLMHEGFCTRDSCDGGPECLVNKKDEEL